MHVYNCAIAAALLWQVLLGRHIRVDLASGSETTKDSRLSVFIGNLPFTASEEQVRVSRTTNSQVYSRKLIIVVVVRRFVLCLLKRLMAAMIPS